jgi:hypothetical protein
LLDGDEKLANALEEIGSLKASLWMKHALCNQNIGTDFFSQFYACKVEGFW